MSNISSISKQLQPLVLYSPGIFFFFKKSKLQILNLRLNKKQYKYEQYLAMHHSLTDSPIAINTRHQLFIFQSPLPVFP